MLIKNSFQLVKGDIYNYFSIQKANTKEAIFNMCYKDSLAPRVSSHVNEKLKGKGRA